MRKCSIAVVLCICCCGCATPRASPTHIRDVTVDVRSEISIIEPMSHDYLDWSEIGFQIKKADVILLGELHDHVIGHAIQLAIVEDIMDMYPGSTLALEMLERDEQVFVDDFMDDIITANDLEKYTHSENWGATGGWSAWYQPIITATKERGGNVVAANAPRRYVRLVRTGGYERIDELPENRRRLIDYPNELSSGRYRERFWELAAHLSGEDEEAAEVIDVSTLDPNDPMLPVFRSQQEWDATMAQSIVNAKPTLLKKVVLLVGQFHVEYDGGLVQELRKRNPALSVFVISIQREIPEDDWRGTTNTPAIADVMFVESVE